MSEIDTTQFARARDVHAALNRALGPELKAAGFKRARPGTCAYIRSAQNTDGLVTVSVQITAWGSSWSGSDFTLNASDTSAPPSNYRIGLRPLTALNVAECAAGLAVERVIRARWPLPPADHEIWNWAAQPGRAGLHWADAIASSRVLREGRWRPGLDIWLSYFSIADVYAWGEFLRPLLLPLLDRYFSPADDVSSG